ncbi:MAG: glycine--tRNA ligase [Nanoarchaeota archaeon]
MSFIVKKKIAGKEYYYLQKSVREGNKIKSKFISYLGKNLEDAKMKAEKIKELEEKNIIPYKESETKIISKISIEELANFCKRKGFVYPSGDIYGGLGGFWDFGHLGTELVNNIKNQWKIYHIQKRDDLVLVDGSIITNPKVWEASGHVSSFVDLAVECKKCKYKSKIDKHELKNAKCDKCGSEYENKGEFNPMFTTQIGPIKENSTKAYLRPETAQLIFANFKLIQENARLQLPFGIAQIGKSFRNEISPREFLFRAREFEQMEIEYFIEQDQHCPYIDEIKKIKILIYDEKSQKENSSPILMNLYEACKKGIIKTDWHAYWIGKEFKWFTSLGANPNNFRARQHLSEEKSHYSIDTWDLEYNFPMGWRELEGFANRGDFDLKQHQNYSKYSMELTKSDGKKIMPHVVCEPSLGIGRALIVFLLESYYFNKETNTTILKLHPKLSPIKCSIFPIIKKPEYEHIAKKILDDLRNEFNCEYDISGSIGRRYARNDEIGTPYCITIDEESIKNKDITIRERDTKEQIRVKIKNLRKIMKKLINEEINFTEAGRPIKK